MNHIPGKDKISAKLRRNQDDCAIESLADVFSHYRETGTLPADCKDVDVTLIPKPGTPRGLEYLRRISLTLYLLRLLEHLTLIRLQRFVESGDFLAETSFGFHPHLRAHDTFLQQKEQVLEHISPDNTGAILAFDLKCAFDNAAHHTILATLSLTKCVRNTHKNIRTFLTNHAATNTLASSVPWH